MATTDELPDQRERRWDVPAPIPGREQKAHGLPYGMGDGARVTGLH
jgi:hypothetical protein